MRVWIRPLLAIFLAAASLGLGGCGYNNLQQQDEGVKAAWPKS